MQLWILFAELALLVELVGQVDHLARHRLAYPLQILQLALHLMHVAVAQLQLALQALQHVDVAARRRLAASGCTMLHIFVHARASSETAGVGVAASLLLLLLLLLLLHLLLELLLLFGGECLGEQRLIFLGGRLELHALGLELRLEQTLLARQRVHLLPEAVDEQRLLGLAVVLLRLVGVQARLGLLQLGAQLGLLQLERLDLQLTRLQLHTHTH